MSLNVSFKLAKSNIDNISVENGSIVVSKTDGRIYFDYDSRISLNDIQIVTTLPSTGINNKFYFNKNNLNLYYYNNAFKTIIDTFIGATASNDGMRGLVPKPTTKDTDNYLSGDGTWKDISEHKLTEISTTSTISLSESNDWVDLPITSGTVLEDGSYILQFIIKNVMFTGCFSWVSSTVSSITEEVLLHRSNSSDDFMIYLRTVQGSNFKMQISISGTTLNSQKVYLKVKKII